MKSEPPILQLLKCNKKLSILSSLKLLSIVFSCCKLMLLIPVILSDREFRIRCTPIAFVVLCIVQLHLLILAVERFGGPAAIGAEVARVFPGDGRDVFLKVVEGVACKQVYDLLKYAYEQSITDIVEACFDCWLKMCHSGGNQVT